MDYSGQYYPSLGVTTGEARSISNAISGKYKVKIEKGNTWAYSFTKKAIIYREQDLTSLTEIDVVANLLHEVGHAKYSLDPGGLSYKGVEKDSHRKKLVLCINVPEDFRVEDILRTDYPYASDYLPEYSFKTQAILAYYQKNYMNSQGQKSRYLEWLTVAYSRIAKYPIVVMDKEIMKIAKKTEKGMLAARYAATTQEVLDIIMDKVYPHIKKLLDEHREESQEKMAYTLSDEEEDPKKYTDPYPEIKSLIPSTAANIRRLLTDNAFDKYTARFTSGPRLHTRKLFRHRLGDWKLFERKLSSKTKDYRFSILIDESGSMYHGSDRNDVKRIEHAIRATMLFAYALERIGIPYSIHGFNSKYRNYKKTNEPMTPKLHASIFEKMFYESHSENAGYNNDGLAIHNTVDQMVESGGTKRVLFVVSDGEPAEVGSEAEMYTPLAAVVKKESKRGVTIVGFGIGEGTSAVKEYYEKNVAVRETSDLPKAIATELKKQLTPQGGKL